jgi:hypothetical protein
MQCRMCLTFIGRACRLSRLPRPNHTSAGAIDVLRQIEMSGTCFLSPSFQRLPQQQTLLRFVRGNVTDGSKERAVGSATKILVGIIF